VVHDVDASNHTIAKQEQQHVYLSLCQTMSPLWAKVFW